MLTIIIVLIVVVTMAQIVYTARCNKEQKAHTEAMRVLWAEKAERKASYPKAVIGNDSIYHSSSRV